MSLVDKVRAGEKWTPEEALSFVVDFHARHPAATSRALARHRDDAGITSYDLVARRVPTTARVVLDLACGDGELALAVAKRLEPGAEIVGVDACAADLEIARPRLQGFQARFSCGRAERLPVDTGSVDAVLCHFAFMLMRPIEPVIADIARVLGPAGRFIACIPGSSLDGLPEEPRNLVLGLIRADVAAYPDIGLGDARVNDDVAVTGLFRDAGFASPLSIDRVARESRMTCEDILAEMRDLYWWDLLRDESRAQLERDLPDRLRSAAQGDGRVRRTTTLRFLEVRQP